MYETLIKFIAANFITLNPAATGRVIFKTVAEVVEEFMAAGGDINTVGAEDIDCLAELQELIGKLGENHVRYIMHLGWGTLEPEKFQKFVSNALQFKVPMCRIPGGNSILDALTGHISKDELVTRALSRL